MESNDDLLESALSLHCGSRGLNSAHQDKHPSTPAEPPSRLVNPLSCLHFNFPHRSWIFESKTSRVCCGGVPGQSLARNSTPR